MISERMEVLMTELRRPLRVQRPLPQVTALTAPFWEATREGVLALQRCTACARFHHPPVPLCPECHASGFEYAPVSGRGTVYQYTVMRQARVIGFEDLVPYTCLVVEIAEQPGVFVVGNLVDAGGARARVGMEVELRFEPYGEDGLQLPQFAPAHSTGA
ncbi:MAG TPA: OB-fold domain-containing protein [Candidatus Dormibacteraeota bacterium]|nr:OB-fold domain-containing protein [Candidatus Dormibacteraeota bacterium]